MAHWSWHNTLSKRNLTNQVIDINSSIVGKYLTDQVTIIMIIVIQFTYSLKLQIQVLLESLVATWFKGLGSRRKKYKIT